MVVISALCLLAQWDPVPPCHALLCRICPVVLLQNVPCAVLSHPVLSCAVLCCPVLSCPVLPCPVLPCPCPALPLPCLSCPAPPCSAPPCLAPALSCPAPPCHALPYPAGSNPALQYPLFWLAALFRAAAAKPAVIFCHMSLVCTLPRQVLVLVVQSGTLSLGCPDLAVRMLLLCIVKPALKCYVRPSPAQRASWGQATSCGTLLSGTESY